MPLGGVSVFFRRSLLQEVGGWDVTCLTEDAEIGIRLSQAGARMSVLYNAEYATREETPPTLIGFIKQRTRWAQGFYKSSPEVHSPTSPPYGRSSSRRTFSRGQLLFQPYSFSFHSVSFSW